MATTLSATLRQLLSTRCLWALVAVLLGGVVPATAQTRDVIKFSGGYTDPNYPGVYFVNVGDADFSQDIEERRSFDITLTRPLGATATQEASITLSQLGTFDEYGTTVTFAPGETTKTFSSLPGIFASTATKGPMPSVYSVIKTNHADAEYHTLVIIANSCSNEEIETCTFMSKLEFLEAIDYNTTDCYLFRFGRYVLLSYFLGAHVKISEESRLVMQTRYVDHTGLPVNADDFGMSKYHKVELKPINAGAISNMAMYIYCPSEDEYLYTLRFDDGLPVDNSIFDEYRNPRRMIIDISEMGPFEVAKPAEGALTTLLINQEDLEFSQYHLHYMLDAFTPTFSNVSIDKTSYKSGETMTITATMDNWHLIKRARQIEFAQSFGVTLNGNETIEPRRYTFDESTGTVTYYVTAPTVSESTTITVDFGAFAPTDQVWDMEQQAYHTIYEVFTGSEGTFSVKVVPQAATPVPATSIDFSGLPADGSDIGLSRSIFDDILSAAYPLAITTQPANATDAQTVTYTVENSKGAGASIGTSTGEPFFNTGHFTGTTKLTATLASGVSTSRTYNLTSTPSQPVHYTNTYLAGTAFPKFQFEVDCFAQLDNTWNWTAVDDDVTVIYTHANGSTWTEHYKFSKLKTTGRVLWLTPYSFVDYSHVARLYELPFVFTEEHPDATLDQIGQPIVSADVLLTMQNPQGNWAHLECTATLEPRLKDLSFSGYYRSNEYYHHKLPPTLSSEVMYLPTKGFSVGYEIPELGLSGMYNSLTDGDNVPEWLELQSDSLYTTAIISAHPDLDKTQTYSLSLNTLAQRTCMPDEVMERYNSCDVTFSPIKPEGHMVYRVNNRDIDGDLTFDNGQVLNDFISRLKESGYISYSSNLMNEAIHLLDGTKAFFNIYDDVFDGADVTLTCGEDTVQAMTNFKGTFTFMPPADGLTYNIEVYYPGYNKRYNNTFISHKFTGIRFFGLYLKDINSGNYMLSYNCDGKKYEFDYNRWVNWVPYLGNHLSGNIGLIYNDDPVELFISDEKGKTVRLPFPAEYKQLAYNITPELKLDKRNFDYVTATYMADRDWDLKLLKNYNFIEWYELPYLTFSWSDLVNNSVLVSVLDDQGNPITDAKLNYACVDENMENPTTLGSANYNQEQNAYQTSISQGSFAQLIEVEAPGYQPTLNTMYLWNYDNSSRENRGKMRRHTIVLQKNEEQVGYAALETLTRKGRYDGVAPQMNATLKSTNLLTMSKNETLNYSENADYDQTVKNVNDGKFGSEGWSGRKYAYLAVNLLSDNDFNPENIVLANSDGSFQLQPVRTKLFNKTQFTTFSKNHCLVEFDLTDQIPANRVVKPFVMNGNQTLTELPALRNNTVDVKSLAHDNAVILKSTPRKVSDMDNEASANGVKMKDANKVFDKFSLKTPPIIPFSLNIEREDDHFIVRGVCEYSIMPETEMTEMAGDAMASADWFNETFNECMDAVKSTKRSDSEEFFEDMQRMMPSFFTGLKGYLSGIGHIDPETGKLKIEFYDGGLLFESSAYAKAQVGMGIGHFGMAVDVKLAGMLGLMNRSAVWGEVTNLPQIDFILDGQFKLKLSAWAAGSIDIWIAKASAGVRGGGSIDSRTRVVTPLKDGFASSLSGSKTTLEIGMQAYAEVRFLFWKAKKSWDLLYAKKTIYSPNSMANPFVNPYYNQPIFNESRTVPGSYKKLKRKVIADLGKPIISNVSGMARPTYLLGGKSLLFDNLKTPADYNDDRLQVYDEKGNKSDLVDTGVDAPMFDFVEAHGLKDLEVVAFEQLNSTFDKNTLQNLDSINQQKVVSEKSEIHVAWRQEGSDWSTHTIGSMDGSACIAPAVAVSKEQLPNVAHAAVIWQQGKALFNDQGERYIDGSLMLSRYNGNEWTDPIEIMRLNRRNVPVDYQMTMRTDHYEGYTDSILIVMTLKQDINNADKEATLVYISVSKDREGDVYKPHLRYTKIMASKPQIARILDPKSTIYFNNQQGGYDTYITDAANLVSYMQQKDNGRDLVLTTVNMKGEPTGKLTGQMGMDRRMVNDYKIVVDDEARDLSDVGLIWNQSDQEASTDGEGNETINIKNRLYASKLCSHDQQLFFSAPVEIATMPDDVSLASMDGYLDGLDMKVAYCVANDEDGAAILETPVQFTNAIDHRISFNPYEVNNDQQVPVTITVVNNGYEPIESVDVTMGGVTNNHEVQVLPQQTAEVKTLYTINDTFDGTIDYEVAANFIPANSNSLKVRRAAASRPHRVQQSGTQMDVRQVDIALKVINKSTDAKGVTTIIAEVNNASLLPITQDLSVRVGLYRTPLGTDAVSDEVTVSTSDLYDANAEKKNKVKIVTLNVAQPLYNEMLYLRTIPQTMANGVPTDVNDVRPSNNVLPIALTGKYKWGDVNLDGNVDSGDIMAVYLAMAGNADPELKARADVNRDNSIDSGDVMAVYSIMAGNQ